MNRLFIALFIFSPLSISLADGYLCIPEINVGLNWNKKTQKYNTGIYKGTVKYILRKSSKSISGYELKLPKEKHPIQCINSTVYSIESLLKREFKNTKNINVLVCNDKKFSRTFKMDLVSLRFYSTSFFSFESPVKDQDLSAKVGKCTKAIADNKSKKPKANHLQSIMLCTIDGILDACKSHIPNKKKLYENYSHHWKLSLNTFKARDIKKAEIFLKKSCNRLSKSTFNNFTKYDHQKKIKECADFDKKFENLLKATVKLNIARKNTRSGRH